MSLREVFHIGVAIYSVSISPLGYAIQVPTHIRDPLREKLLAGRLSRDAELESGCNPP